MDNKKRQNTPAAKHVIPLLLCIFSTALFSFGCISQEEFQTKTISDNVLLVTHPDLGNQVVVQSDKGLLIFDSFWSETTARKFKKEISKATRRDDFAYVIDMVDRLDMIGGNGAYPEAVIIGHAYIPTKYKNKGVVDTERTDLIEMWREKEVLSRKRLEKMEEDSEAGQKELKWVNKCKNRADELESGFAMIPPQITYADRMTLDLGNLTASLRWFGETGNYRGLTMAVFPEEKLAVLSKSIIFPRSHLAPYPHPDYKEINVPRWIGLLEEILEGDNAVDCILLSDYEEVIPKDMMLSHLHYIRKLWNGIKAAVAEGRSLEEIQDQLSLEKDFAFVKDMQVYKNESDAWIHPQHEVHILHFYRRIKNQLSASDSQGSERKDND